MVQIKTTRPVILGGTVMDLRGRPDEGLQLHTSNPGQLLQMPGGVGRNIAENLVRLGISPLLISAVGTDLTGDALCQHAQSIGLDLDGLLQLQDQPTAVYLAVLERLGDLHTAIADMRIFAQLTPERLAPYEAELAQAPLIVVDTNLPQETLTWVARIAQEQQIPLWVEPVSVEKSRKVASLLSAITYISPNVEELAALADLSIESDADVELGIQQLLDQGVESVLVTMGAGGLLLGDQTGIHPFPALKAQVVDVTGAGDSFVAGTIYGLLQDGSIYQAIPYGLAVAKLTVETGDTVEQNLSVQTVRQLLMEVD